MTQMLSPKGRQSARQRATWQRCSFPLKSMAALTLYTWPPATGGSWASASLPSVCVECMAAEAYLDLLGVAYNLEHCTSPEQSPSGALPAVVFDDEPVPGCQTAHGHALGHAARVATLKHVAASVADLDGPLSSGDKAHSAAFCALLDACVTPALVRSASVS